MEAIDFQSMILLIQEYISYPISEKYIEVTKVTADILKTISGLDNEHYIKIFAELGISTSLNKNISQIYQAHE